MSAISDLHRWASWTAVITVAVTLAAATTAGAQGTVAPPGNSGVDQYFEVVPDAGGGSEPRTDRRNVLPAKSQRRFEQRGSDGRDVLRVVEATTPDRPKPPQERKERSRRPENRRAPLAAGTNALIGKQDGGMGILLPLLIAFGTMGIGAIALWRRGSGGAGPSDS